MEAFGLAALEAMACGVPPVATLTGGVPDLITHGVDGYMETVGDVDAQARRLTELLTDDELRARMSAAARSSARSRFSTELVIPRYEAYYSRFADSRARGTYWRRPVSNPVERTPAGRAEKREPAIHFSSTIQTNGSAVHGKSE